MVNFCTLFDSAYMHYGLCLHASLMRHCQSFHLYIFAFDDKCRDIVSAMRLENVTVISMSEFEDEELLAIKPSRTKGEYCWTCTPSVIRYVLNRYQVDSCTYVDSDLFFFSDPSVLLEEMGGASVSIIEHRYHPDYDQTEASGKYCVQFMTFKNNDDGMKVLNWWRGACIEWCFNRREGNRFGDQKYLDDWMTRFEGIVCEIKNEGAGLAPWNARSYVVSCENGKVSIHKNNDSWRLIFYHFHGLKLLDRLLVQLTLKGYLLSLKVVAKIYHPYLIEMNGAVSGLSRFGYSVPLSGGELKFFNVVKVIFGMNYKNTYRRLFLSL